MNSLSHIRIQDIKITNHALERARQRLSFDEIDNKSFLFETKLKELIKKSYFSNIEDNGTYKYIAIHNKRHVTFFLKKISATSISVITII